MFVIAAVLISFSYFFTDILLLRFLAIFGCTGYMAGCLLAGLNAEGMLVIFIFSVLNFIVNALQSVRLILDRRKIDLPEDLKDIYHASFSKMQPNEFLNIYKMAELKTVHKSFVLIKENMPVDSLILIQKGEAIVTQNDSEIASLGEGFFAGEMSFLSDSVANANIVVKSRDLVYLCWDKDKLEKLKSSNHDLYEKLKQALSLNVILKVAKHVKEQS